MFNVSIYHRSNFCRDKCFTFFFFFCINTANFKTFCYITSPLFRWPVGPEQLPCTGPGAAPELHPLHGGGPRPGLVWDQEQDPCHPSTDAQSRGENKQKP